MREELTQVSREAVKGGGIALLEASKKSLCMEHVETYGLKGKDSGLRNLNNKNDSYATPSYKLEIPTLSLHPGKRATKICEIVKGAVLAAIQSEPGPVDSAVSTLTLTLNLTLTLTLALMGGSVHGLSIISVLLKSDPDVAARLASQVVPISETEELPEGWEDPMRQGDKSPRQGTSPTP